MLMNRHTERVRGIVRSVLKDDAQIDDVLQETFLRAYMHLSDLNGEARFASWVTRIAVNEALWRKRRAVEHVELDGVELRANETDPEHAFANRELCAELERAVEALPENYRDVFMLRVVDGFSVAETAWVLGVSEEAVRTRAFRANEALRELLSRQASGKPLKHRRRRAASVTESPVSP
jgi:RNA polymerase sigma-70 factor (ECF subfamily)